MGEIRLGEMGLGEMGLGEMGQNLFSISKKLHTMLFTLRCIQCIVVTSVLQDQQSVFGVRSLLMFQKLIADAASSQHLFCIRHSETLVDRRDKS